METLILFVTLFFFISLILLIFFVYVPNQQFKNKIKSQAAADRAAKRKYDKVFNDYPTISRHCTNGSFQDTEVGYELIHDSFS